MARYKVGYLVGSLSSTSINRELSKVLIRLAPENLSSPRFRSGTCPCTARTMTQTIRPRPRRSRKRSASPRPYCSSPPSTTAPSQAL